MKSCFVIFFVLFLFFQIFSQTTIPAGPVSGNWDFAGSPYLIDGEIEIPNGQTLTIDPGCLIEFQGHYKLNVKGRLLAEGTQQDSINFTAQDHDVGWHGIRFENTSASNDTSKLTCCILEFGRAIGNGNDSRGGAVFTEGNTQLLINDCLFKKNYAAKGGALYHELSSNVVIINNQFLQNEAGYGGATYLDHMASFRGNIVSDNTADLGGGTFLIDSSICNNLIENNSAEKGGGLFIYEGNSLLLNNTIKDNGAWFGSGIYINGDNEVENLLIGNLITGNNATEGGGIYLIRNNKIINSTIYDNFASFGSGIYCVNTSNSVMYNSICWNNIISNESGQIHLNAEWDIWEDPLSGLFYSEFLSANLSILYSNIQDGYDSIYLNYEGSTSQYPITYSFLYEANLESDPIFLNPQNNDFHLNQYSPCINTGTPDTTGLYLPEYDLDGNQRIYDETIDMGCYEWQGIVLEPIPKYELFNYPNPFNPSTTIEFNLPQNYESSKIEIYNIIGQRVKSLPVILSDAQLRIEGSGTANNYSVVWNGSDSNNKPVSSGIYFYQLKVDGKVKKTRKMLLLK